jgi:hypothetical protein
MPPAMKVYIHHDEGADAANHTTIKIKLPKKWRDGPVLNLKETFIEHFNKKHPEQPLALADVHVEDSAQTRALADDAVVSKYFKNGDDVFIKTGAPPASTAGGDEDKAAAGDVKGDVKEAAAADGGVLAAAAGGTKGEEKAAGGAAAAAKGKEGGKLRCRNYGCNSHFVEAENGPEACQFHTKPPIFHDTKKGWSCCPKRVYDWDEFQLLVGCARGPHSTQEPGKTFALSPNYSGPEGAAKPKPKAFTFTFTAPQKLEKELIVGPFTDGKGNRWGLMIRSPANQWFETWLQVWEHAKLKKHWGVYINTFTIAVQHKGADRSKDLIKKEKYVPQLTSYSISPRLSASLALGPMLRVGLS